MADDGKPDSALSPSMFAHLEPGEAEFRQDCGRFPRSTFYTYFAQAEVSGLVKIGRSNDPWRRADELRLVAGEPVAVLATMRGDFERRYHAHFEQHRHHREWFSPAPEILAEIARLNEERV